GDVLLTNNGTQCTKANAGDITQCYPSGIKLGQPDTEAKLKATENPSAIDTAQDPHRHVASDKPPAMAVWHGLIALRLIAHPHPATTVELGFRDAIFAGAAVHYLF